MRTILIAYGAAALAFLALDAIWLSSMVGSFYRPRMGALLLEQPRLGVAAAFYLLYVAGVVLFAILPGLRGESWATALGLGAALGLLAYATYDLTNLATLRGFPAEVAVVDMVWGTVATGAAALAGYQAARWLG